MSRRVVVTGMGAISPIGNDVPTMWKNMVDGVCGIETITAFDTSDLKVHIAGTVKDFDPTQYIEKKEVRKLDPYTQYAIAAAQQAVDDSGIIGKIDENRFGVYIGAGKAVCRPLLRIQWAWKTEARERFLTSFFSIYCVGSKSLTVPAM